MKHWNKHWNCRCVVMSDAEIEFKDAVEMQYERIEKILLYGEDYNVLEMKNVNGSWEYEPPIPPKGILNI